MAKPKIVKKDKKTKNVSARISDENYKNLKCIYKELGYSTADVLEFGIQAIIHELDKNTK